MSLYPKNFIPVCQLPQSPGAPPAHSIAELERWLPEEKRGSEQRPDEPHIGETKIGGQPVPLLRFMGFPPTPDASGDLESMDYLAGQGVGLVNEIKPAAEVIRELLEGARHILSTLTVELES